MKAEKRQRQAEHRRMSGALGFGTSFAAGMAVFSIGGHYLGVKIGRETACTLAGVGLGFAYGGWELWKLVVQANQRIAEQDRLKAEEEGPTGDESSD